MRTRTVGVLAGLALAGVGLGLGPAAFVLVRSHDRVVSEPAAPSRDVTMVLGAGLQQDGRPTPFLAARLDVATRLYKDGRTKVLLVSGDNSTHQYDEPSAMRDYLVAHGVPADRVVLDYAGRDTYASCVRARKVFGVDRLLVVSQGYHLPRAVTLCRGVGVDAVGVGDWSAQQRFPDVYRSGQQREVLADIKAVGDLVSQRDPILGPPETGVRDALAR